MGEWSPAFAVRLVHLEFDGVANKPIQALSLAGGEVFDDLPLAFFDDDIDPVVGLFVVPSGSLLLGVVIFGMFHKITSNLY